MARIALSGSRGEGRFAIVDDAHAATVSRFKWSINERGYVVGACNQRLHRFVWQLHSGSKPSSQIDHRNRDPLDNRTENLREATHGQNQSNRAMVPKSTGFKGVYPCGQRFTVIVNVNGKSKRIGTFEDVRDAARCFDEYAAEKYGEFALTNAAMGLFD